VTTIKALALTLAAACLTSTVVAQEQVAVAATPKVSYFEHAKITVNARARADGFMRVRVIPENGAPREATFDVLRRMNENDLASQIAIGLNKVLAPDYVADKDNGEHVKIERKTREAANFAVEITFNAPGFSVILEN
jgi:hypothetical protein